MPYYFTRMSERVDRTNAPLHVEPQTCISGNDTFSSHLFFPRTASLHIPQIMHPIKLYPPGVTAATPSTTSTEPVVHEFYNEVVFTDPRESFHKQCMRMSVLPKIESREPNVQAAFPRYSDEEDWKALLEAQTFLDAELKKVKHRLMEADMEMEELDLALIEVAQAQTQAAALAAASSSSHGGSKSKSSSGSSKSKSK